MKLAVSEKDFQAVVVEMAQLFGWRCYHTFDSRKSAAGFPDLVLVKAARGELLFVELKTEKGRLTPEQRAWKHDLEWAGQKVHVWRPSDMDAIKAFFGGGRAA